MKKLLLIILIMSATVQAADTELQDLAELTAIASADVFYVVDDPAGTPASRKITALNIFDMIDTFAELQAITANKTLINEEDALTFDAIVTFGTNIAFSDAATIDQSANNYIDFSENSDTFQMYFGGTDLDFLWSDGALNIRNAEDTDAIINLQGKDAGEKAILRVMSDGDDKYIELYNDDTDSVITTSAGNIIINPVGLGIVVGDNGNEDYTLTFDGDTSNGVLNYDEDNADFEFDQDVSTGGTFTATTSVISPLLDAAGAEDMDYGSADVTDHTFLSDGTGTGEFVLKAGAIDGTEILDDTIDSADYNADSIDNEHINWADIDNLGDEGAVTLAATVTISDDEATDDNQEIVFTTDNATLESDGDLHYNPSTGTITATEFVGGGAGLTAIDGENISNDTIDNDSIDWGDMTDLDTDGAVVWGNIAEGELANSSVIGADIKDDTIDSADYAGGSIDDEHIADDSLQEPALNTTNAAGAGTDNYLLSYNNAGTNFTWVAAGAGDMLKATYDSGISGGVDVLTTVDSTYASDYVLLTGTAVGTAAPKTDGALTYDATSGALAATSFSGAGTSLTALNGENISDDTIDEDSIDFGDITGADLTLTDAGVITASGLITGNAGASFKNGATAAGFINIYEDSDDGGNYTKIQTVAQGGDITLSLPPDDGDAGEQLQTNGGGVLTWEAAGGAGATAWDDIGDPDAAATVDFVTYTQTIDIGVTDDGGPKSGLILDVTGLGAGVTDVIALEITTATNDDSDYIPIAVYDDSGADNDLLFKVDYRGAVMWGNGGAIQNTTDGYIHFTEGDDWFWMYFDGTDCDLSWSDGVFNIRNQEDGVDAIVEIEGKDAGEKGILRVLSDGDDNYIELYHDDTDGHIVTDTGDIHIEAAGGDINLADDNLTTTGTLEAATITEGGVAVYNDDEMDELSEILTILTDVTAIITDDDMPAAGVDPDVDAAGEIGRDTDDHSLRGYDGSAQYLYSAKDKPKQFTITEPDQLAEAANLVVWTNNTAFTFNITEIQATADTDDATFTIKEVDADGANATTIEAVTISTDGTNMYYTTVAVGDIDHKVIEAGHRIMYDASAFDTDYIHVALEGYFGSDVP